MRGTVAARSTMTKAAKLTTAAATSDSTPIDAQPQALPCVRASNSVTRPTVKSAAPARSMRPPPLGCERGTHRTMRAMLSSPMIAPIEKSQRQPMKSVTTPPMTRAAPAPAPSMPLSQPIAAGWAVGIRSLRTIARASGNVAVEAPCRTLAARSVPKLGATSAKMLPTTKNPSEISSRRLCP